MEYMLMFYISKNDQEIARDAAAAPAYYAGWMAYVNAIHQSGHVKSGSGLQGRETATTVKVQGGRRLVQDGPFADTKEQLGGFFVIDVPSLDEALSWAARAPCASTGGVEVRPVMLPPA